MVSARTKMAHQSQEVNRSIRLSSITQIRSSIAYIPNRERVVLLLFNLVAIRNVSQLGSRRFGHRRAP